MRRSCALALGLALAVIAPVAHAEEAALERFESAVARPADGSLVPGAEGTVVTVLEGNRRREIPLTYLGTYRDFSGPGYDLHLVQLQGPEAERVGVAAGMSGSPVYFDGKMIGALAYRLGFMPKTAVAGVTPIEDMLDAAREEPRGDTAESGISPIATPVVAAGLSRGARDWIAPRLGEMGFVLASGGGGTGDGFAPAALEPGSAVGVELVRGDMRIAATGTVTWVDGDRVYAFGHPFLGTGRVEMPMVSAEVIHTLGDLAGSFKLSNLGDEIGAVVEDRHAAIVGRLGQRAAMIPVRMTVRGADYGESTYEFEVVDSAELAPVLSAVSVMTALQTNAGYSQRSTLMARGKVRMANLPDLPLEMAAAGTAGSDPSAMLAGELSAILGALWRSPFENPGVRGIDLTIDARREIVSYSLESLHYDREEVGPGDTLEVRCLLRPYRGEPITRTLTLQLPDRLPADNRLVLAVGNPRTIDGAMGNILSQRFRSAADPAGYVGVLADLHGPQRLMALVLERGGAVIAGGGAYSQLPPTAERLLATQNTDSRRRSAALSPIARAETELDGPISGMRQVHLRVRSNETRENR